MAKIFISYKRNIEPDMQVARAAFTALSKAHQVFIDTTIQVGEKWAERIQSEIKQADYLIIFLSEHSVHSEMVIAEVETAHHHNKARGKPAILPVRLRFTEPLVYPLSAYLNPLQWAVWENDADTDRLIAELSTAVSGGRLPVSDAGQAASATPAAEEIPTAFANIPPNLGSPEGTMTSQSPLYVERDSDREALQVLCEENGVTITIKGPRQMGKSSLLNRIMAEGCGQKMRRVFLDFQLIEDSAMKSADVFYRQFCSLLSWELGVEDRTDDLWKGPLGQVKKTTNYVQRYLLQETKDSKILLAMDEVERMFASPFRSDFFSMLRSWHNSRALGGDWTRFNIALVTSTEPYQFIVDLNQSPFNVGQVVELTDFDQEQVTELNRRHNGPLLEAQLRQLSGLLSGHPYLTRKALYLLASRRADFSELLEKAYEDNGPFGDHLRNYLFRMSNQAELKTAMVQVIKYQRCPDERIFFQLRGAGLVKRIDDSVVPRNKLYADYFRKRLSG